MQTKPFTITFNPCKSTKLAFVDPTPYVSRIYYLQDPSFEFATLPEAIVSKDTTFDCGPYLIDFFNNADSSPINGAIFDVNSFSFKVK